MMLWPLPRLGHVSYALPRLVASEPSIRYNIIIHNCHPFILFIYVFETFKTQMNQCMTDRCQLNVFVVCVLLYEFSLVHLHGFLIALLGSADSQLPRSRSRENCLTHITGY